MMTTTAKTTAADTILAIDLGKYKCHCAQRSQVRFFLGNRSIPA
jgi:hypothetical protein